MANPIEPDQKSVQLQFHYIKAPDYREIACHGALGGMTPNKLICMSLFSERGPIPRVVEYAISGQSGEDVNFTEGENTPTHIESRAGIIRNVQVSAYLALDTARQLHQWLGDQIKLLESAK